MEPVYWLALRVLGLGVLFVLLTLLVLYEPVFFIFWLISFPIVADEVYKFYFVWKNTNGR